MRLSRAELYERLARRDPDPEAAARFDAELWSEVGTELTVLVADLSGFSRQTRRHGVVHFLAVHRRCVDVSLPIVNRLGGEVVKAEADNWIAVFGEPSTAVESALDVVEQTHDLNRTLPPDAAVLPCFGIAHGPALRLSDDMFGEPVNTAYKLGEDVARPFEVLVAAETADKLARRFALGSVQTALCGGVELVYRQVQGVHPPS